MCTIREFLHLHHHSLPPNWPACRGSIITRVPICTFIFYMLRSHSLGYNVNHREASFRTFKGNLTPCTYDYYLVGECCKKKAKSGKATQISGNKESPFINKSKYTPLYAGPSEHVRCRGLGIILNILLANKKRMKKSYPFLRYTAPITGW